MAMEKLRATTKAIILLFCLSAGWNQAAHSCSSTTFADIPTERTRLVGDLESYQSVEQVRSKFGALWSGSQVIENSSLTPGDKRPPFNIYTVLIKNYSDLNQSGELKLKFFNNRLMQAWFYPSDYDAYVELLKKKEGLTFTRTELGFYEARIPPHTRVWLYEQDKGKKSVAWEDIRLGAEHKAWIMKYS